MPDSGNSGSSSPDSGDNNIPRTDKLLLGKYEIGKLLGCGAFAKVYHARNVRNGQSVAIKSISKQKILKSGLVPHIKREISIMRRLRHPHIVKLYEVLASRSKIYFIMEYVKGGELFAKVARGRLPEDTCRKYFQQLISAVGFCHSRGVFHRDLKPENLLLDENGDLKISDFGLSAVSDQIRGDGLFHTLCGTPAYVAPEILAKKGYDGAKIDLWSCGVILFVLNAGYLPFNDPNLMAMYRKIYKGEFRCPRWTPPDMKRLLYRLLDTNTVTRITVDEILNYPWFRKGFKDVKMRFYDETPKEEENRNLNAFDIISFSNGFDLSGLFNDKPVAADRERFLSGEQAEKIVEKVEEFGKREKLEVRKGKKTWRVEIEGQDGNYGLTIEIYQLTEGLVVVEVTTGGDARAAEGLWMEKLRPFLNGVECNRETPIVLEG